MHVLYGSERSTWASVYHLIITSFNLQMSPMWELNARGGTRSIYKIKSNAKHLEGEVVVVDEEGLTAASPTLIMPPVSSVCLPGLPPRLPLQDKTPWYQLEHF